MDGMRWVIGVFSSNCCGADDGWFGVDAFVFDVIDEHVKRWSEMALVERINTGENEAQLAHLVMDDTIGVETKSLEIVYN